jgi:alkanesulfonate monooxygenase SsuD/methylene tetrahydromethanopterin reductase-like flavin-dependent oxidoreductase (luciferase family)
VELFPKPLQKNLPIYFGGNNRAHLRRTATCGDGWIPAGLPLQTLRPMVDELKQMTEAAGRDFSKLQIAPQYVVHLGRDQNKAVARYRESQMFKHFESLKKSTLKQQASVKSEDINLVGSIETVVERAQAFRDAGVTHFLGLFFAANSVNELMDQMQMFAEEVRPKIR